MWDKLIKKFMTNNDNMRHICVLFRQPQHLSFLMTPYTQPLQLISMCNQSNQPIHPQSMYFASPNTPTTTIAYIYIYIYTVYVHNMSPTPHHPKPSTAIFVVLVLFLALRMCDLSHNRRLLTIFCVFCLSCATHFIELTASSCLEQFQIISIHHSVHTM